VKDVLRLLKAQHETERLFVTEVAGTPDPAEGWTPAMMFFHVAQWRDRLWNGLASAAEGRPVNAPPDDIDEFNDAEMAGAAGVSLAEVAARSDAALTSLIAIFETIGDRPFKWYLADTVAEALIRNSYIHPRIHLADQFRQNGELDRSHRLLEESAAEVRRAEAPGHILGAALYKVAGIRAVQGRADEAMALLEEGVPMRPDLKAAAAEDPDLASVRDSPRFRALIEGEAGPSR
jgi:hypothetical protein